MKLNPPQISLILVNIVPLVGVFLGWSLFSVLFFYWFESLVIGFFNIFKMLIAPAFPTWYNKQSRLLPSSIKLVSRLLSLPFKLFIIFFFIIHYGIFMTGHLFLINTISSLPWGLLGNFVLNFSLLKELILGSLFPLLPIFISHGISFFHNFIGKQEYKKTSTQQLMMLPYKRVILMHITLLFGGFLLILTGMPIYLILLFIILKIIVDLKAHNKEHGNLHGLQPFNSLFKWRVSGK